MKEKALEEIRYLERSIASDEKELEKAVSDFKDSVQKRDANGICTFVSGAVSDIQYRLNGIRKDTEKLKLLRYIIAETAEEEG